MRVLVTGADGFIGGHVCRVLQARGHDVVRGVRRPRAGDVEIDFARDRTPSAWVPRLRGIEAVVNAVGVARGPMGAVHDEAPRALFDACVEAGVRKVVQLSALGADERAETAFHLSKRAADDHLASLPLAWVVVLPSLVVGRGGASTSLFSAMASLPLVPLPGAGEQQVQPIAIDDLARGIVAVLESDVQRERLAAVGPAPMTVRELLTVLARSMGIARPWLVPVPMPLVAAAARVGDHLGSAPVTSEMLTMLARGNTADVQPWTRACGFAPRPLDEALGRAATADRQHARLYFVRPLLRLSVAFIWIATAIICAFVYPVADSYALLAQSGIRPPLAPVALYGACLLDLVLGLAVLVPNRWTRPALLCQVALVATYSLLILFALPAWWIHPFGPLTKNIPLIGAILALWAVED